MRNTFFIEIYNAISEKKPTLYYANTNKDKKLKFPRKYTLKSCLFFFGLSTYFYRGSNIKLIK